MRARRMQSANDTRRMLDTHVSPRSQSIAYFRHIAAWKSRPWKLCSLSLGSFMVFPIEDPQSSFFKSRLASITVPFYPSNSNREDSAMLVEKEVIRPGTYWYKDESTGLPKKLTVTPELTRHWHDEGNRMIGFGLQIPVPYEHDFSAHPMTPKDNLLNNAGEVKSYSLKGDTLFSSVDVQDPAVKSKIGKSIRWTSPWINSFTDGDGRKWSNVISHLALTTRPRITKQEPFGSIAAALSMASDTTVNTISDKGLCLSRAGLLTGNGQPEYPIAFSMWGGVALANPEGVNQYTGGRSGGTKPRHKVGDNITYHVPKEHTETPDKPGSGYDKYKIKAKVTRVTSTHKGHFYALKATDKGDIHSVGDETTSVAEHHLRKHHNGGAAMGGDFPPKGKPKPGGKPGAPPPEVDDDPTDAVDDADPNADDIDSNDDANEDGIPDILEDANGDIAMEELLCDLLQALGVPMPDESNEDEFKRHLYEAVMSKIKELTSTGLKKEQDKNDPNQPDQNKPPNQNPNTSHPNKAANPLIQQEQQPMYMSLEEINKLPDPMKGVALAMYNENVKLRSELDAGAKVTNSLRDSKIKEENAKRASRVALLSRLSPKVKTDLDAMLALPSMALSMGEGGAVVDPMAQTLAILEKGLADMPRLLTTDHTALSVQPHPQDADAMTSERADEIADQMARQMGCPPEKKAG